MKRLEQYDVFALPAERIYYDGSFNCRGEFTLLSVKPLADNIEQHGLQFPVVVQPAQDVVGGIPPGYDWRLIAGHRRFKALTTFLKRVEIPASVRHGLDDHSARVVNLTENLERQDLNPLEEALAIGRLFPRGASVRQIAREITKDTKWVHARLRILKLPEHVQQMVAARRVTMVDIEIICRHDTPEGQIAAAEKLAAAKRGRGRRKAFVGDLTRSFRSRLTKAEMNAIVEMIYNAGVDNYLACRAVACCAGYISIDEFTADLAKESTSNRAS